MPEDDDVTASSYTFAVTTPRGDKLLQRASWCVRPSWHAFGLFEFSAQPAQTAQRQTCLSVARVRDAVICRMLI